MNPFNQQKQTISITPSSLPARPWPFEFAELARVATELRASGVATLQISAELNNDEAGLLLHELAHKVGRPVHFVSRTSRFAHFAV